MYCLGGFRHSNSGFVHLEGIPGRGQPFIGLDIGVDKHRSVDDTVRESKLVVLGSAGRRNTLKHKGLVQVITAPLRGRKGQGRR